MSTEPPGSRHMSWCSIRMNVCLSILSQPSATLCPRGRQTVATRPGEAKGDTNVCNLCRCRATAKSCSMSTELPGSHDTSWGSTRPCACVHLAKIHGHFCNQYCCTSHATVFNGHRDSEPQRQQIRDSTFSRSKLLKPLPKWHFTLTGTTTLSSH
eukprot:scaffold31859_cov21-Tisochrysis_lutea.AAC.1